MSSTNTHPNIKSLVDGKVLIQVQHLWGSIHGSGVFLKLKNKQQHTVKNLTRHKTVDHGITVTLTIPSNYWRYSFMNLLQCYFCLPLLLSSRLSSSSSSNWILMSCQPHRVTSGQSNSGHKQIHISKLFSHIYQPSVKSIYKNQSLHKHKTHIQKHQTQIFEELVPSISPLLKEHIRLGHAGIVDHSV